VSLADHNTHRGDTCPRQRMLSSTHLRPRPAQAHARVCGLADYLNGERAQCAMAHTQSRRSFPQNTDDRVYQDRLAEARTRVA